MVSALATVSARYGSSTIRVEAARVLSEMACDNAEARAACEGLIAHRNLLIRHFAALGLLRSGVFTREVLRYVALFFQGDEDIRQDIVVILRSRGAEALREIRAAIDEDDARAGFSLLHALGSLHTGIVEEVGQLLRSSNPAIRLSAAILLRDWQVPFGEYLHVVEDIFTSGELSLRLKAGAILRKSMLPTPGLWEIIVEGLQAGSILVRMDTTDLLTQWGAQDASVREASCALITNNEIALTLLPALQSWGSEIKPILVDLLSSESSHHRLGAARLLDRWGNTDIDFTAPLMEVLAGESGYPRLEAARFLRGRGVAGATVLQVLMESLETGEEYPRNEASRLLNEWGAQDRGVRDAVSDMLGSDNVDAVLASERLLAGWGTENFDLIERWVRATTPEPWEALAGCQHVLNGRSPNAHQSALLAKITTEQDSDDPQLRDTRAKLRTWLWSRLEPAKRQSS